MTYILLEVQLVVFVNLQYTIHVYIQWCVYSVCVCLVCVCVCVCLVCVCIVCVCIVFSVYSYNVSHVAVYMCMGCYYIVQYPVSLWLHDFKQSHSTTVCLSLCVLYIFTRRLLPLSHVLVYLWFP